MGVATEPAGVSTHVLTEELIDNIFLALFIAIGDYTIDSRGDIGTMYVCCCCSLFVVYCLLFVIEFAKQL